MVMKLEMAAQILSLFERIRAISFPCYDRGIHDAYLRFTLFFLSFFSSSLFPLQPFGKAFITAFITVTSSLGLDYIFSSNFLFPYTGGFYCQRCSAVFPFNFTSPLLL